MRTHFVNIAVNLLFCGFLLLSCNENRQDLLCKTWKGVALKNDRMDQDIRNMQTYIDTLGDKDAYLQSQFDIDSLKALLQAELNKGLQKQQEALESTRMEFRRNGIIISHSAQTTDTAQFQLKGENDIQITETKGNHKQLHYQIISLTRDTLKMQIEESGEINLVTMIPVKN